MRETRADNVQSLGLAVGLHLLLFALVFIGLRWTRENAEPAGGGPPVEAEMVDAGDLSSKMKNALAERIASVDTPEPVAEPAPAEPLPQALEETPPPPQPLPEPEPQEALTKPQPTPPAPVAKPDTRDQDEARRDAINRETREREQEALRRERQIELQKEQQQKAAEEKKRLAAQQQADADAKAKAAAKAQADAKTKAEADAKAKRAASLAAQRAQQLADAKARAGATAASSPGPASGAGQGKDTRAEWLALVVNEIERQWRRPDDIPKGLRCPIRIKLLPGGEVLSAEVQPSCPYSEQNQRTVEAAVKKASPLPLKGNEDLRLRDFIVNFYPSR